jgi:Epoxide hydrolase N terminus
MAAIARPPEDYTYDKAVLGLGAADPAFIARGEQNFCRFAAVLDDHLKGRSWLIDYWLNDYDFNAMESTLNRFRQFRARSGRGRRDHAARSQFLRVRRVTQRLELSLSAVNAIERRCK